MPKPSNKQTKPQKTLTNFNNYTFTNPKTKKNYNIV